MRARRKLKTLKPMQPPIKAGRESGEHNEQVTFFEFVRLNRERSFNIELREALELCYAVPNGAYLNKTQRAKMSREGREKGILDINVDVPTKIEVTPRTFKDDISGNIYFGCVYTSFLNGLRIEMKVKYDNGKKNYLSKEQKRKKELFEKNGYKVEVCYSAQEAIKALVNYLPYPESDYQGLKEYLK